MERRVFGPVPSRRLGKSLGINNIPYKICTYQCIYCQLGKAVRMQANRQEFYRPEELVGEVKTVLDSIEKENEYPDYVTLVPDGEPTLDIHMGELIERLGILNIPVAVITNASLMHLPEVREELLGADYVSLKVDTVQHQTWKKVNKPHKSIRLEAIEEGIQTFARLFTGKLVTETMLIRGFNDSYDELTQTARFIRTFTPETAYIAIPTRPPAFRQAVPADEETVNEAYHIFRDYLDKVELLTGYEGNAFSSTGHFREDILSITAVHPMREDAVRGLLHKTNDSEDALILLLEEKQLEKLQFNGHNYYLRRFSK
ncbi:MAG: radical SAM protein [Bacteroidales bacterium]|nr:radical SAM protein [Bacteroidales bacterium]MBN2699559.1 radical SAM protein [Bacteroidales bacterium]